MLGVVDEEEARGNEYGAALLRQIAGGDALVRWSLRTDDLDAVATARGLRPEARSRRRPDGVLLTWRAAGLSRSLVDGWLPFFMQWDDPSQYPGGMAATHAAAPQGVAWLELTPRDPAHLSRWIGDATVPLRIVAGEPGLHRVGIQTAAGDIVLP